MRYDVATPLKLLVIRHIPLNKNAGDKMATHDVTSSIAPLSERLSSELKRYKEECAYPSWDAYHAEPLLPETITAAQAFLDSLPHTLRTPDVFVDPTGELFFEWNDSQTHRAVAFINHIGRISYSMSHDDDATIGHGYLPQIPADFQQFLLNHFST